MTQAGEGPHVVVGVDGTSCSLGALDWAATYVQRVGGDLRVVTVWRYPVDYRFQKDNQVTPQLDAEQLNRDTVARVAASHGIPVTGETMMGWAPTALVDASREADLLVVGQHNRTLADVFTVSVSEYCTRHAACSTVVVHEREEDAEGPASAA